LKEASYFFPLRRCHTLLRASDRRLRCLFGRAHVWLRQAVSAKRLLLEYEVGLLGASHIV
jgi:hypothetical protein